MSRVYLYKRYERFWHWSQAVIILILFITGFELHGSYSLMGYETASTVHNYTSWAFIVLIAFTIFWHFTTGEWRQYIPTRENLDSMVKFYISGIFKGEEHPVERTAVSKLNPLQRLVYLGLKVLVIPVQVTTGLLYYFHPYWRGELFFDLGTVAAVHTLGNYALLAFLIAHIYLSTTGHTPTSNIKAMVTGYEDIPDEK